MLLSRTGSCPRGAAIFIRAILTEPAPPRRRIGKSLLEAPWIAHDLVLPPHDPETLALAQQRIASSRLGWLRAASTPSAPEIGINRLFRESDQRHYLLPCPGCGLEQALTLDNLDAERVLLACSSCGSELDLWAEGRWEAAAPSNGAVHGYHLPRLYSPWANLEQIVHGAELHSLVEEQQFRNQVMGEVFRPEGGNLTEADLERCVQPYAFRDYRRQECVMGVDVGKVLHVVIREKVDPRRLWHLAELGDFAELGPLFERFNVVRCVIDAYPELHTAEEFARASRGKVWLAYYDRQAPGHHRERGRHGAPNRVHIKPLPGARRPHSARHQPRRSLFPQARTNLASEPAVGRESTTGSCSPRRAAWSKTLPGTGCRCG